MNMCGHVVPQEEQSTNAALRAINETYRANSTNEFDPVVNAAIDEIQRDVSQ